MRKLLFVVLVLAGCAKSPESISPSYVSDVGFQSWSCEQLGGESLRLHEALAQASTQQQGARRNDIIGVVAIGLPVSSLSGDNIAPEIARLKGESEAVNRAQRQKNCSIPTPPVYVPPPARSKAPMDESKK